jgi:trimeric autotransporter adhesin
VDEALGEFCFNLVSFSDIGSIPLNHVADLNQQNVNISNVTPFGQLWVDIQGIEGSGQADQIIGDATSNWLIGGGGNDLITGGGGDDVIIADSIALAQLIGANGLLTGSDRHFVDLLASVPNFNLGYNVTLGATGITYTASVKGTSDIATYAGGLANFTIAKIRDGNGTVILGPDGNPIGLRIIDKSSTETGAKGDLVIGAEKLVFNYDAATIAATTNTFINLASLPTATTYNVSQFYDDIGSISLAAVLQPIGNSTKSSVDLTATVLDPDLPGGVAATYQWFSTTNGVSSTLISGATAALRNVNNGTLALVNTLSRVASYSDSYGPHSVTSQWVQVGRNVSNADTLNGTTGADILIGLNGGDTYIINDVNDRIIEDASGDGTDTANASVSYTLVANVENLTLTGNAAINGTGNGLDNVLTGNAGINVLTGGAGNDTYVVQTVGDSIVELLNQGNDTVQSSVTYSIVAMANVENLTLTGNTAINATGNTLDNILTGNNGNNVLTGGAGNDTYIVQNIGDSVVEALNAGIDTVQSSVTWSLAATGNIENLTLTGNNNINGTGNALDNLLTGNSGNNVLTGGAGNDTYIVDNGDSVVELVGGGIDTVQSSVNWTLDANVENLILTGNNNRNGTGNTGDNQLRRFPRISLPLRGLN